MSLTDRIFEKIAERVAERIAERLAPPPDPPLLAAEKQRAQREATFIAYPAARAWSIGLPHVPGQICPPPAWAKKSGV